MKKNTVIRQTIVELPEFIKQAKTCLSGELLDDFIDHLAQFPLEGDLIPDTGGARKIRWCSNHLLLLR